jgi:chromosome segregation ATPase
MPTTKTPEQDAQEIKGAIRDLQDAVAENAREMKHFEGFSSALRLSRDKIMEFSREAARCNYDMMKVIPMITALENWAVDQTEPLQRNYFALEDNTEKLEDQIKELNQMLVDLGSRPTYKTEEDRKTAKLAAQKRWRDNRRDSLRRDAMYGYGDTTVTLSFEEYREGGIGPALRILAGCTPGPAGQVFVIEAAQAVYLDSRPELVSRVWLADLVPVPAAGPQPG